MKRLLPVLSVMLLILSGCQTTGHQWNTHGKPIHTDDDWNLTFYENASMPRNDSLQWIEEGKNKFIRFRLDDKHYGGGSTDRNARHNAPYWERAEVMQTNSLNRNAKYELEFMVRFVEGYAGNREDFWQMHSWSGPSCSVPPIHIKFTEGKLVLDAMRPLRGGIVNKATNKRYYSDVKITDLIGKWNTMGLKFDTSENPEVSLYLNGRPVFSDISYNIPTCGIPHFKFGIYRPGSLSGTNLSVVDYDKIKLTVIDKNYDPKSCLRQTPLVSETKVYSADKCEANDKELTLNQGNHITRWLKMYSRKLVDIPEKYLRWQIKWALENIDTK